MHIISQKIKLGNLHGFENQLISLVIIMHINNKIIDLLDTYEKAGLYNIMENASFKICNGFMINAYT